MKLAFIQMEGDGMDGVERLRQRVVALGMRCEDFEFCQYAYVPPWLEDSFSKSFCEGAALVGQGIIVDVAWNF